MKKSVSFVAVVTLLALASTVNAQLNDDEVLSSLVDVYGGTAGADPASQTYFMSHGGKKMFEQASMLEAMALAKAGKANMASKTLASLALQCFLAELPQEWRAVGDLLNVMESNRLFFKKTLTSARQSQEAMRQAIKAKLTAFQRSGSKTSAAKEKLQNDVKALMADQDTAREAIFNAWKADFAKLKQLANRNRPSPKEVKAWHVYGKVRYFVRRLDFPPQLANVRPFTDILGIVISGMGLHDAIKNQNKMGIVNNILGIVGCTVALGLFAAQTVAKHVASKVLAKLVGFIPVVGPILAIAFFLAPIIVQILWPRSLAIETANKLTEVASHELQGYRDQLVRAQGFGWLYQINSGVLIESTKIRPNTPIKFFQPSCKTGTAPCDPKTAVYQSKRYLVLGEERRSTYSDSKFQLDVRYDFLGAPLERKFCGNTINVNTGSFREYIEFLSRRYRMATVGLVHRNVKIDTSAVPQYNDVDLSHFSARDEASKRERKTSHSDDTRAGHCEPESDRISIDELTRINPVHGQVKIDTGAGNDVFVMSGMVGRNEYTKNDFLVVDLGADGNLLSIGATLNIGGKRGSLSSGIVFDNSYGDGDLYFLKGDWGWRRVGNVKGVTIFKGSRLHDEVTMGTKGPFTVIQNEGANIYSFNMFDLEHFREKGQTLHFQIMDISNNVPEIRLWHQALDLVTHEIEADGLIKLILRSTNEVLAEVHLTGYMTGLTDADIQYRTF